MSKRPLDADIPVDRYLYVRFCDTDGPDGGVSRFVLSFTDLALGARVHQLLLSYLTAGDTDGIDNAIEFLGCPAEERDLEDYGEETRDLILAVGHPCLELKKRVEFGAIKNGFVYDVAG